MAFAELQEALSNAAAEVIGASNPRTWNTLARTLEDLLGPTDNMLLPGSDDYLPHEELVRRLFLEFGEIAESFESLRNVPIYIQRDSCPAAGRILHRPRPFAARRERRAADPRATASDV